MSFGGLETTGMPEGAVVPELVLAGHGPRSLALAATCADTWNTYGGPGTAELDGDEFRRLLGRQIESFAEACERHGRDPEDVRRSLLLGFGRVLPTTSVDSYLAAVERAGALGFDVGGGKAVGCGGARASARPTALTAVGALTGRSASEDRRQRIWRSGAIDGRGSMSRDCRHSTSGFRGRSGS